MCEHVSLPNFLYWVHPCCCSRSFCRMLQVKQMQRKLCLFVHKVGGLSSALLATEPFCLKPSWLKRFRIHSRPVRTYSSPGSRAMWWKSCAEPLPVQLSCSTSPLVSLIHVVNILCQNRLKWTPKWVQDSGIWQPLWLLASGSLLKLVWSDA